MSKKFASKIFKKSKLKPIAECMTSFSGQLPERLASLTIFVPTSRSASCGERPSWSDQYDVLT